MGMGWHKCDATLRLRNVTAYYNVGEEAAGFVSVAVAVFLLLVLFWPLGLLLLWLILLCF